LFDAAFRSAYTCGSDSSAYECHEVNQPIRSCSSDMDRALSLGGRLGRSPKSPLESTGLSAGGKPILCSVSSPFSMARS
jgi:hypothetical protein